MRFLVLDLHALWADFSPEHHVDVEKAMFNLSQAEVYGHGNPVVLDYVREMGPSYDLIIIGNNLGAGLPKAKALDPSMRLRAIVCWNDEPGPRDYEPYQQLGYQHFVSRPELAQYILDHPEIYARLA